MGIVHSLKGDSGIIAVEVTVLHEMLDGIDNLVMIEHICPRDARGSDAPFSTNSPVLTVPRALQSVNVLIIWEFTLVLTS